VLVTALVEYIVTVDTMGSETIDIAAQVPSGHSLTIVLVDIPTVSADSLVAVSVRVVMMAWVAIGVSED